MPRKPREDFPGALHHVFARGNRKQLIAWDDFDLLRYLVQLGRVVARYEWRCLAYCLMHNHVHLIVETPAAQLGAGVQYLHGQYARGFNDRHAVSGHVFQGRYGNRRVRSDAQFWGLAAYVARNPVKAGLCARPEEWRWSSHAATAGQSDFVPPWLDVGRTLELFSSLGGEPRERYVDFVG